ncbi:acetoacetate decarboxylase [Sulfolobus sp. A20]|uniref:acetoacetate decarboxylase family protein n=1 Tax=Saccharolobus sp. A20 TaxID=1891280 RepID=UPI0008460AD7|nr:acetoacetate decarboxylase family protein [Sulfolobus sp. A20]TRM75953.1 acetoacetate decarboxylase [Sulfolobus sp. A20-N-F8]TRM79067.1 acetoacetate decarboxylase [Sulfolobus sp. B5]TRM82258.1 acetoacetate decarboxylase [Sulfolobus sp. D5]TRM83204.1 acetoacetate decarboxylase [Sulfolobus sp. A20-N-F6]TRM83359.1 acetoacetate decarboxylase [Sulfolobus sp. F3]TRM87990.1 acetoacetate decarboxylase [Sulfolobus sp. C3]TRM93755.1 acetoacetate decarboxylase [Sulfolobus sp. A20-N-G8]TRN03530.1 ac
MEKEEYFFTAPLSTSGKSSLVPPPPWIYGIENISAHVYFNVNSILDFIPKPLDVEDGEGWIYIASIISTSERNLDMLYEEPELTQYMEWAIAVKVKFNDNYYTFFPFMWVDKDFALYRGIILGYPKKFAKVEMSRFNPMLKGYSEPKEGVRIGGYSVRGGEKLMKMVIELKDKVNKIPFPFGPIVQFRRFPSIIEGTDVFELVQVVAEAEVKEGWKGDVVKLELNGGINDEVEKFKVEKVLGGYYYNWFLRQKGAKLLYKVK